MTKPFPCRLLETMAEPGGKSPRSEVHASVISRIAIYKAEGAELSTPVNTQAEDSAPFTDDKIAYYLSTVNRAKFTNVIGQ